MAKSGNASLAATMAATLASVSNLDIGGTTGQERIEYFDIDQIQEDPGNFYSMDGLEELGSNILLCGLQQPLRVRRLEENPARAVIVSGHRRAMAIRQLVEEGHEAIRRVPCIVEQDTASPAMRELRLVFANSSTRTLTAPDISRQAQRVEALLCQLKDEGVEFPGRMRDHVAAACQVSKTKLARLKVIREGLIPPYMEMFDAEKLTEQAAYALAGMPVEFQQRCIKVIKGAPKGYTAERLREFADAGLSYAPTFACPDGTPCHHGDAFLRHDAGLGHWGVCKAETCCLLCNLSVRDYRSCENACTKAKMRRKEATELEKSKTQREKEIKIKKNQVITDRALEYCKRMNKAAELAGRNIDAKLLQTMGVSHEITRLQSLLDGSFETDIWSCPLEYLPRTDAIASFCRIMGCSADYLLGLSEEER